MSIVPIGSDIVNVVTRARGNLRVIEEKVQRRFLAVEPKLGIDNTLSANITYLRKVSAEVFTLFREARSRWR